MLEYAEPVTKLIDELKRLPSIGHKSAQRLAFHIMRTPVHDLERLITAIREVKERIAFCSVCNNLTDVEPCRICVRGAVLLHRLSDLDRCVWPLSGHFHGQRRRRLG